MLTALALALAFALAAADDIPVIGPTQATAYVGQDVVVLGQVQSSPAQHLRKPPNLAARRAASSATSPAGPWATLPAQQTAPR
jgi:hypothetical protein